jgi:hypothetical protein
MQKADKCILNQKKAYAIICLGKMRLMSDWTAKSPRGRNSWGFLFRKVAYAFRLVVLQIVV